MVIRRQGVTLLRRHGPRSFPCSLNRVLDRAVRGTDSQQRPGMGRVLRDTAGSAFI